MSDELRIKCLMLDIHIERLNIGDSTWYVRERRMNPGIYYNRRGFAFFKSAQDAFNSYVEDNGRGTWQG